MEGKYRRYDNTEAGFGKFLIALKRLKKPALVVFESTGSISLYFAEQLDREGIARACLNPAWIRHHAKSIGRVAKTDKIDCELIASYAQLHQIKGDKPMEPEYVKNEAAAKILQHTHQTSGAAEMLPLHLPR